MLESSNGANHGVSYESNGHDENCDDVDEDYGDDDNDEDEAQVMMAFLWGFLFPDHCIRQHCIRHSLAAAVPGLHIHSPAIFDRCYRYHQGQLREAHELLQ